MYPWIVFLHVAGAFGFMLAHGTSVAVAFALHKERNLDRARALLELSRGTFSLMYGSILVLLAGGITAGFMGSYWGRGWIWAAIATLVIIMAVMGRFGTVYYSELHKAVGLPYTERMKPQPAVEPVGPEELSALLAQGKPALLTGVGLGGLVIILWLMMFKPF